MATTESRFSADLEESAQGHDLFRAPGHEHLMAQAREQAEASGWVPPRVAETWPVDDHRTAIAKRRQRLYDAMRQLEWAAARASQQHDWLEIVSGASVELKQALDEHVEQTEGAGEFLEDLVSQAPRLAADADLLRREHRALVSSCERLQSTTRSALDIGGIRRSVLVLLGLIVEHRQRGAELLYDAFNVDLGDGD